jgi:hypothetical protein
MQALRPVTTVSPLQIQTLSRKAVRTTPAALEETNDTKTGEESSSTAAADHGVIALHSDLPAELLSLPQMILGKTVAFAAYLANQAPLFVGGRTKPGATAVEDAPEQKTAAAPTVIVTKDQVALAGDVRPLDSALAGGKGLAASKAVQATVSSSYRANDDQPVYVPVPDELLTAADQPSRFQTLRQNFSDKVKDTYYRMMTMVPYSVGMFLNVFA